MAEPRIVRETPHALTAEQIEPSSRTATHSPSWTASWTTSRASGPLAANA